MVGGHNVAGGKKKNTSVIFLFVWPEPLKATVTLALTIWETSAAAAPLVQEASGALVLPKFSPHHFSFF